MNKTEQITPQIIMADLLNIWPETLPVLIKHRMNCMGCSMAPFDTLAEALNSHHVAPEPFMDDLDRAISNQQVMKSDYYKASI